MKWLNVSSALALTLVVTACGTPEAGNEPSTQTAPSTQTDPSTQAAPPAMPANSPPQTMASVSAATDRSAGSSAMVRSSPTAEYSMYSPAMPDTARYQALEENKPMVVKEQPVSTFSIDVDTGSYSNMRRFISQGQLPPEDAIRLEEMVNYFNYNYPTGKNNDPFGVSTEMMQSPWNPNAYLLRISMQAKAASTEDLPPANLVFLVDVSGSMGSPERLPLVQATLKLLLQNLRKQDTISLVTYAGGTHVRLEATAGDQKDKIREAIDGLSAGGSTAGASGIQLAYREAEKNLLSEGINRVIIATDGDFNVGITSQDELIKLIEQKRAMGISLTALGYGTSNYNEHLMEQLADHGNGNYAYIDNIREARKVLSDELSGTLFTVASDVKAQIEFNPNFVSQYRLLGYENRLLNREDFNNDKIDAGEIGAGHRVTVLYEVIPTGKQGWVDELRYASQTTTDSSSNEIANLSVRFKRPGETTSELMTIPLIKQQPLAVAQASADMRFAVAVAAFAQQLKGATYTKDFTLGDTIELAQSAKGDDEFGLRAEFIELLKTAQALKK